MGKMCLFCGSELTGKREKFGQSYFYFCENCKTPTSAIEDVQKYSDIPVKPHNEYREIEKFKGLVYTNDPKTLETDVERVKKELTQLPKTNQNGYNWVGKYVVLYPTNEFGLPFVFLVSGGSGSKFGNIGTGVFGTYVIDGEYSKIHCGDVMRYALPDEIE